jgi:hypothetical protein
VAVSGNHDGLGVGDGFDGCQVDRIVAAEGLGFAESLLDGGSPRVALTDARSANRASARCGQCCVVLGDSPPRRRAVSGLGNTHEPLDAGVAVGWATWGLGDGVLDAGQGVGGGGASG